MNDSAEGAKLAEQELSPTINAAAIHSYFNTPGALTTGIVFGVVAAGVTAEKSGLAVLWAATAGLALTGALRYYTLRSYLRQPKPFSEDDLNHWKVRYKIDALLQAFAMGMWAFLAITFSDDPIVHMFALSVSSGITSGGAARAYGQQRIFHTQAILVFGPLGLALFLKLTPYYVLLSFMAFAYIAAISNISANLHTIFVRERTENERATYLATHDQLTDLLNVFGFRDAVLPLLANDDRGLSAMLLIDLDHFKEVNDTLGHPVGDKLLAMVARRLNHILRAEDIAGRFGGDEFCIFASNLESPDDAAAIAERIVDTLSQRYDIDDNAVEVGASVGVAFATPPLDYDILKKNADLALYGAKDKGRGVHCFFEPGMAAKADTRRALEMDFKTALDNSIFELHYQPIINLKKHRISSCEALLRWNHPQHGCIDPLDIVKLAEEAGRLHDLSRWVLTRACGECTLWPDDVAVAVNLSPAQLRGPDIIVDIRAVLKATGLPSSRLIIEITEGSLLDNDEKTRVTLSALRALGVRLSLDDFGTGYSSLSYLHRFPFQLLKIDRTFLDGIDKKRALIVLRKFAELATDLGMAVVVEGIETDEQLALVTKCSTIDSGQGYLFSEAVPASEIRDFIAQSHVVRLKPPTPANDDRPFEPDEPITETSPADHVPTVPDSQPSKRRPARQSSGRSRRGRGTDKAT